MLYVAGISLNVLTLGGLAIAIGRVVDDAVVVLENIYRHVQSGERPRKAVISATREVGTAVTASTATTLAVFAPLAFVGGLVGEFFRPFALAVVVALAASLLVALTIVPVLASYFVRPGRRARREAASGHAHEDNTWLQRIYTPALRWSLGHRWIRRRRADPLRAQPLDARANPHQLLAAAPRQSSSPSRRRREPTSKRSPTRRARWRMCCTATAACNSSRRLSAAVARRPLCAR